MEYTKLIAAIVAVTTIFSCSKAKKDKNVKVGNTDSVTNEIYLDAYGAFDTTNDLKGLGFYKSREIGGLRRNYADDKMLLWASKYIDGDYKIRYIGQSKFIDPVKVYFDGGAIGGETVTFYLNDSLKGKPIFEVYNENSKAVYKRIIASPDSCSITVYLGWVTQPFKVDTNRVRKNYHYYLSKIDALNYKISED